MTEALSSARIALVRVSAAVAARDPDRLRDAMVEAASAAEPRQVEEVLVQSYLFVGYPIALTAMGLWRELTSVEAPSDPADDQDEWRSRGQAICQAVYAGQYEGLRANIRRLHPDMEQWMVDEGYGKVLGRPGLDLATRELCIAALLAVLDAPHQLYSHLRGALNVGAETTEVDSTLDVALAYSSPAAARRAGETWQRVRARSEVKS